MNFLHFIAIVAEEPVQSKITALKMELQLHFNSKHALRLPAHITLVAPYRTTDDVAEKLMQQIRTNLNVLNPFKVTLSGFGFFLNKGMPVLFINVLSDPHLNGLYELLNQIVHSTIGTPSGTWKSFHPHITLAHKDLNKLDFSNARDWLSAKSFEAVMPVSSFTMFRHNGKVWVELQSFKLEN